jgi:hypothetical protein
VGLWNKLFGPPKKQQESPITREGNPESSKGSSSGPSLREQLDARARVLAKEAERLQHKSGKHRAEANDLANSAFKVDQIVTAIDFISRPSVDEMIETLLAELNGLKVDKILVISGFEALKSVSESQFTGYEYLYNSFGYFGWLLKICEYARETQRPQIIVSRFPRHWNPPKIKVVQASFDPNIFAVADGSVGGTVHEISGFAGAQFMNNPNKITLNIIDEIDDNKKLGLYFLGLHAASYYREVLASQGCPPRKPNVCKVISGPGDPALELSEHSRLRAAAEPEQQAAVLREASDKLEQFCVTSEQRREKQEFAGGVLVPKFPQNEQLPPGARGAKTAK